MDGGKALLVTLMFVSLVSLGIVALLSTFATAFSGASEERYRELHFVWMAILLLAYFDLFWQSDFFVTIDDWRFQDFLFVVAGPIVLLIATHVLLASAVVSDVDPSGSEGLVLGHRFLGLLIGAQVWFVVASALYAGGLTKANFFDLTLASILGVMMASPRPRTHIAGTVAVAVVYTGALTLVGLQS